MLVELRFLALGFLAELDAHATAGGPGRRRFGLVAACRVCGARCWEELVPWCVGLLLGQTVFDHSVLVCAEFCSRPASVRGPSSGRDDARTRASVYIGGADDCMWYAGVTLLPALLRTACTAAITDTAND